MMTTHTRTFFWLVVHVEYYNIQVICIRGSNELPPPPTVRWSFFTGTQQTTEVPGHPCHLKRLLTLGSLVSVASNPWVCTDFSWDSQALIETKPITVFEAFVLMGFYCFDWVHTLFFRSWNHQPGVFDPVIVGSLGSLDRLCCQRQAPNDVHHGQCFGCGGKDMGLRPTPRPHVII